MNIDPIMHYENTMNYETQTLVFFNDFAADIGLKTLLRTSPPFSSLHYYSGYLGVPMSHPWKTEITPSVTKTQQDAVPVYESINYLLRLSMMHPTNKIIVFAESHEHIIVKLLASFNAFYLLSKKESPHFIHCAITTPINVYNQYASPDIIKNIGGNWNHKSLSSQEWFILNQLAKIQSPATISNITGLSVKTISNHKRNAMKKLGYSSLELLKLLIMLGELKEISTMIVKMPTYRHFQSDNTFMDRLSRVGS
ncbi:response regulator transcription factor [Serratia fonticola]|uniref:helix-turn-helix transcriptional regulator n=1 Tax=Serratia fonticola TaxID=47917 RepID=UPI0015755985|nr:LuxR C-terminal-related transcriptional regulator [Serratia fonticola]NTY87921.1 response regulator transcription factor [Serratia fonticola]NTZ13593.1 response regulator transcription factor [Serratia fonticola]